MTTNYDRRERYETLRELMAALKVADNKLAVTAETVENAEVLRACADAIQAVRAHFWPGYMDEVRYQEAERFGGAE